VKVPISNLATAPINEKRVLVRADLNVPRSKSGKILNDFKLKAILPTLQLIKMRGGKIILLSHSGRPESSEPHLSMEQFVTWFKKHEFTTIFAKTPESALKESEKTKHDIILLENLRFFPGEQTKDVEFAKTLARLGQYFVQDAFGNLHRDHTSMTLLAEQFDKDHKTIGLLIEKELIALAELKSDPKQPFILILGGSKPSSKLPIIEHLLDKVSAILPCPALVFTLLQAQGIPVGKSLVDKSSLETARRILQKAKEEGINIVFPVDYLVTPKTFEKPIPQHISKKISDTQVGVSFGPETAALFKHCILQARTIFLNGISGNPAYPETLEGMRSIFLALQQTYATKIIGGGDVVAVAQQLGFDQKLGTFLTGGGATLAYLSGDDLPGLLAVC
jgi:phosphoglycerate kinase